MFGFRIKEERQRIGFSQELLADKLGVSRRTVIGWEKDEYAPNAVQLFTLYELGFDPTYIITGQSQQILQEHDTFDDEFVRIPVYNIEASAGHGSFFSDENILYYMAYRKEWLRNRGLFARNLGVILVNGDSMEPTINNRESILVHHAETTAKDGNIYVVRSGDMLWVKRIQRLPNKKIQLISDNAFYPPITFNLEQDDLHIVGKVVNSSRNFY